MFLNLVLPVAGGPGGGVGGGDSVLVSLCSIGEERAMAVSDRQQKSMWGWICPSEKILLNTRLQHQLPAKKFARILHSRREGQIIDLWSGPTPCDRGHGAWGLTMPSLIAVERGPVT